LGSAGVKQIVQPEFTATEILGLPGSAAPVLVRELGFANLAVGLLGLGSLAYPTWVIPACVVGGLYFGFAGIRHTLSPRKTGLQTLAMVSDLAIFVVLAAVVAVSAIRGRLG
jgi:hypothetical protein